jgi:hypothetical protein
VSAQASIAQRRASIRTRFTAAFGTLNVRGISSAMSSAWRYNDAKHAAVRDHRDRGAGVAARDVLERGHHPVAKLHVTFAAGHDVLGIARGEPLIVPRPRALDLGPGHALELAVTALAQTGIELQREAEPGGDRRRSVARAPEIARDDRIDALAGKARRERVGLCAAGVRKRTVLPALQAAFQVPQRFAVAKEQEVRQGRLRARHPT